MNRAKSEILLLGNKPIPHEQQSDNILLQRADQKLLLNEGIFRLDQILDQFF